MAAEYSYLSGPAFNTGISLRPTPDDNWQTSLGQTDGDVPSS